MPLYEYKCSRCEEVFEVRQRFSDKPVAVHEKCGGAVKRLLSPPALHFKGTGWYVTDYAHGNGGGRGGKSNGDGAAKTPAAGQASSETKSGPADTKSK